MTLDFRARIQVTLLTRTAIKKVGVPELEGEKDVVFHRGEAITINLMPCFHERGLLRLLLTEVS